MDFCTLMKKCGKRRLCRADGYAAGRRKRRQRAGGGGAAGAKCGIVGIVGDDAYGQFLRR